MAPFQFHFFKNLSILRGGTFSPQTPVADLHRDVLGARTPIEGKQIYQSMRILLRKGVNEQRVYCFERIQAGPYETFCVMFVCKNGRKWPQSAFQNQTISRALKRARTHAAGRSARYAL